MKNSHDSIKELLRLYRLDSPVPAEVQRHLSSRIERVFAGVMRKTGIYSTLFALFSYIFFLFKRLGILFPLKNIVILGIVIGLTSSGLVYLYVSRDSVPVNTIGPAVPVPPDAMPVMPQESKNKRPAYRLALNPLRSGSVDNDTLSRATMIVSDELSRLHGRDYWAMADEARSAAFVLSGYIEKTEGGFVIFVKVVNSRSSAIVYVTRDRVQSLDEIPESCRRISAELSRRVR
ncbi:MAG: hypothetical protein JXA20_09230 [Spirochaetes bacterium]|nr:hypothetical protein [Spirochaetota bacterium]